MLLVLDYPGRRPEARISDLRLEESGYDVRYLMQPPLPREPSTAGYVAEFLPDADVSSPVHAILTYCGASALGQELALRTGCPHLLSFNAELCTPRTIGTEYRALLESVTGDPVALPPWWDPALLADRSDDFLKRCEAHLLDHIRQSLAAQFGADPADPTAAEDLREAEEALIPLLDGFLDWLAYLAASHRADHPAVDTDVISFLSQDQPAVDPWPGARSTRTIRVDTTRDDLLAHAATRGLVLEALHRLPPSPAPFDGGTR
ncbi:hypothetical protein GCM10009839_62450 [Catenulispora yoronensis]|uniref:DUF1638 domain-containing protein n=1 Tax=Catenulispora yoronensis TaxID=450799 RepID=A0ABN2V187_9ACTN